MAVKDAKTLLHTRRLQSIWRSAVSVERRKIRDEKRRRSRRDGDAVAMDTEDLPPDEEAPEEEMEDMTAVARNAGVTNDAAETARALDALHIAADAEAELTQTRYLERHWRQQESILQGIPFPMLEELRRNRTVANYPGHMRKGRVAMDEGIELLNRMWRGSTHG